MEKKTDYREADDVQESDNTCEQCGGTGEVEDRKYYSRRTIDQSWKPCPECQGRGIVD